MPENEENKPVIVNTVDGVTVAVKPVDTTELQAVREAYEEQLRAERAAFAEYRDKTAADMRNIILHGNTVEEQQHEEAKTEEQKLNEWIEKRVKETADRLSKKYSSGIIK